MSTTIRPEVSEKNQYWIEKHRYYELKHFCLQYPIWRKSYGEKSPDGKRFVKSEELSTAFSQTEAYSQLYMELATDADKAAEFINGVIPNKKPAASQHPAIAPVNN